MKHLANLVFLARLCLCCLLVRAPSIAVGISGGDPQGIDGPTGCCCWGCCLHAADVHFLGEKLLVQPSQFGIISQLMITPPSESPQFSHPHVLHFIYI